MERSDKKLFISLARKVTLKNWGRDWVWRGDEWACGEFFFGSLRQSKANEPAENKVLISTVLSVRLKYAPPYPSPDPLRPQKRIQKSTSIPCDSDDGRIKAKDTRKKSHSSTRRPFGSTAPDEKCFLFETVRFCVEFWITWPSFIVVGRCDLKHARWSLSSDSQLVTWKWHLCPFNLAAFIGLVIKSSQIICLQVATCECGINLIEFGTSRPRKFILWFYNLICQEV